MTARYDLDALTAATEADVTPGPWTAATAAPAHPDSHRVIGVGYSFVAASVSTAADATHIAAHDPDTCTALHAVVRAALAVYEYHYAHIEPASRNHHGPWGPLADTLAPFMEDH